MGSSSHRPLSLETEVNSVISGGDLAGVASLNLPKAVTARSLNLKLVRSEELVTVGGKSFRDTVVIATQLLQHWPDNYAPEGVRDYQFLMKLPRGSPGDFCVESSEVRAKVSHTLIVELDSDDKPQAAKQIDLVSENLFELKELRVSRAFSKSSVLCFGKSAATVSFTGVNAVTIDTGIIVKLEADLSRSLQSLRNIELRLVRRLELVSSRALEETVSFCSLAKVTKGRNYSGEQGIELKLDLEQLTQQCTSLARGIKLKYRLEISFDALNRTRLMKLGEVGVYSTLQSTL